MDKKHIFYSWLIWLLSAFFMFYKNAIEVSPGVMTAHLMSSFKIDGAQLGNLAACYFYAYLIMQIPAGILIDRFGPRKITTIAIAVCALGSLLFCNTTSLFLAQTGRFLAGAGAAFAAINCLKLIANWFPMKRFAFMAGLMMTVGMLGAVGGQAPLLLLIKFMGWQEAMNLIALIGIALAIVFWLVVRDRSHKHHHLFEVNLIPEKTDLVKSLKTIFANRQAWMLSWYSGLAFAPVVVFGGLWGVSFMKEAFQLSHTSAAHAISLIFFGFALGAPFSGWFSDWLGKRRPVMFTGTFIALIALTLVLYLPNMPVSIMVISMFLFGFFISFFLLCFTMIREINAPALAATAVGFMNAFDALFGAFSDPLTGKLLDMGWQGAIVEGARVFPVAVYKFALLTLPLYLLVSLLFLFLIKETYCKSTYPTTLP